MKLLIFFRSYQSFLRLHLPLPLGISLSMDYSIPPCKKKIKSKTCIALWIRFSRTPILARILAAILRLLRKLRRMDLPADAVFLNVYISIGSVNATLSALRESLFNFPAGCQFQIDVLEHVNLNVDRVKIIFNECGYFIANYPFFVHYINSFPPNYQHIIDLQFLRVAFYDTEQANTTLGKLFFACLEDNPKIDGNYEQ